MGTEDKTTEELLNSTSFIFKLLLLLTFLYLECLTCDRSRCHWSVQPRLGPLTKATEPIAHMGLFQKKKKISRVDKVRIGGDEWAVRLDGEGAVGYRWWGREVVGDPKLAG